MSAIKSRPTTYKGIRMRSRLEADYAAMLDRMGVRWEYEPECFAGSGGQWLPDFGYSFTSDGPLMIFTEVKPAEPLAKQLPGSIGYVEHVDSLLRRVAVAWESRPEVNLNLMFWQYGSGQYLSLYCARRGAAWKAEFGGQPMELLWTGSNQHAKASLKEPTFHDEIARRWLGLFGATARHAWPGGLAGNVLIVYADGEEWAAKIRRQEHRLIEVLGSVFCDGLVRKINVELCEVAS